MGKTFQVGQTVWVYCLEIDTDRDGNIQGVWQWSPAIYLCYQPYLTHPHEVRTEGGQTKNFNDGHIASEEEHASLALTV